LIIAIGSDNTWVEGKEEIRSETRNERKVEGQEKYGVTARRIIRKIGCL
jgi:hypothetical protein